MTDWKIASKFRPIGDRNDGNGNRWKHLRGNRLTDQTVIVVVKRARAIRRVVALVVARVTTRVPVTGAFATVGVGFCRGSQSMGMVFVVMRVMQRDCHCGRYIGRQ
ncbi:MAG: hypothetical protein ACE5KM_20145 [Planctomycetaceae bacterium]